MPVRTDRFTSIKQRLRQGADNFDFGALIEGVSTIEEEAESSERAAPFVGGLASVLERPAAPKETTPDIIPEFDEPGAHLLRARHSHTAPVHHAPVRSDQPAENRLSGALRDLILRLNNEI